jgi:hypothetical protein
MIIKRKNENRYEIVPNQRRKQQQQLVIDSIPIFLF